MVRWKGGTVPRLFPVPEQQEFGCDLYFQCFDNVAHGDTFDPAARLQAIETFQALPKPCVEPAEAFAIARQRLRATDGFCIGIYPKDRPTELRQNVGLAVG